MSAADQSSLSPVAQCLRIAAQRGRALRLAREQAQRAAPQADDAARNDDAQAQLDQHDAQPAAERSA